MHGTCKCGKEAFLIVQSPKRIYFSMCKECLKNWIAGFLKFYSQNKNLIGAASKMFRLNFKEIMNNIIIYIKQATEDMQ